MTLILATLICFVAALPAYADELTSKEAEEIALKQVKGHALNVRVLNVDQSYNKKGEMLYEFVIDDEYINLMKIVVHAETGEVIEKSELDNYQDVRQDRMADARKKAVKHVDTIVKGGNTPPEVVKEKFKHVGGQPVYEFVIKKRTRSYKIRVDGNTGNISSVKEWN